MGRKNVLVTEVAESKILNCFVKTVEEVAVEVVAAVLQTQL